jgi:hypothetical protein
MGILDLNPISRREMGFLSARRYKSEILATGSGIPSTPFLFFKYPNKIRVYDSVASSLKQRINYAIFIIYTVSITFINFKADDLVLVCKIYREKGCRI